MTGSVPADGAGARDSSKAAVRRAALFGALVGLAMLIATTVYTRKNLEWICGEREQRFGYISSAEHYGRVAKPDTRSFVEKFLNDQAISIGCEERTETTASGETRIRQVPSTYAWIALHHYLVGMKYGVIVFAILFTFHVLPGIVRHLIWKHFRSR